MNNLLSAGIIFLGALMMMKLSSRFRLPSVTAYLVFGILIGPYVANLVSAKILEYSGLISNIALSFIAFSLGQNFTITQFRKIGKMVISISVFEVLGACVLVTIITWLLIGIPFSTALVFGAIAAATAPAAVVMVTREFKARGPFTDTLLSVVAIDDAWGIILFAFCLAVAKGVAGQAADSSIYDILRALIELIGSLCLGIVLGFLLPKLSHYIRSRTELLIMSLGFILLNAGLAMFLHFSILLANMTLGATLINIDRASDKYFTTIRTIDMPFYLLFFVLAGSHLEIPKLLSLGLLGIIYIVSRLSGKICGAFVGATVVKASSQIRRYLGFGLAPQAGVALGLALIAYDEFPVEGGTILSIIIITTIVYELFGPILTRIALEKAGEIKF